jgi:hypothetical protein
MKYRVEADRYVIVEGLGVFYPGDVREFDEGAKDSFIFMRGIPFNQAAMPEGVTLTVVVKAEEE